VSPTFQLEPVLLVAMPGLLPQPDFITLAANLKQIAAQVERVPNIPQAGEQVELTDMVKALTTKLDNLTTKVDDLTTTVNEFKTV
jgi:uncharacterized protein YlxW (UPF0749 family)